MLGLIFIFFVARSFYRLANQHNKPAVLIAILGIVSYYGMMLLSAFVIGVILAINDPYLDVNDPSINKYVFIAIPIGLLSCFGTFKLLERNWKKKKSKLPKDSDLIDDAEFEEL